ncbi:hypothetical protein [Rhizohabitans arisaemae]|uniref:hypothetical protein n=1 Tax=Rhizohabitans arisaemae TaxID=2720610 RepID=UPI0024B13C56|nr:hypothetical protein [Rhizohabitans arisaemae]
MYALIIPPARSAVTVSLITELAARLRAIADALPMEALESGRESLETAIHTLTPVADGGSSPLPEHALAHFSGALNHVENARGHMPRCHDLIILYAATILGHGWVVAPPRYHGAPFNADYEDWVRRECGGPPGREYLVVRGDEKVLFDAARTEQRDGIPVEVLIDAKGRYAQFIDKATGEFHSWWAESRRSGLPKLKERALDQVQVGAGRPVEWWCAERNVARLLNGIFALDNRLAGRIRAVHRPMPPE